MASDWTDRIRLRNLRFLLSLAQTGNISRSAKILHTTQPALSKWLGDLERDVGLTLFERRARGLAPTIHGKVLIAHARRLDAQMDRAASDMRILSEGGAGHVAIGASGAVAAETAPRAMLSMAASMPDLRISLTEGTMDRLLELLAQGDLDLVMGRTISDSDGTAGFGSEVLYTEPVNMVARQDHPLFRLGDITWEGLQSYRWVIWPRGTSIRRSLESALRAVGRTLKPDCIESNSVIANVTLLSGSDFIGMASHRAGTMLASMGLLRILPIELQGFGSVSVYWRRDELYPHSIEQALACIRGVVAAGGSASGLPAFSASPAPARRGSGSPR